VPPDIRAEAESIFKTSGAKGAASYLTSYETASTGDKQRFVNAAKANGEAAGKAQGEAGAAAAESAAKSKAQGWGALSMPVKADTSSLETSLRNIKPPTVYVPGIIVKPGTKQPL
jgi:hypothetical protein